MSDKFDPIALFCAGIAHVIDDALDRFTKEAQAEGWMGTEQRVLLEEISVESWPQSWGSTACGFGGLGGQMMTTAQTVICVSVHTGTAVVYHGFRYAYTVERPGDLFRNCVAQRRLPGAIERHGHLSRMSEEAR